MIKIRIDASKCIGAGQCVLAAPKVFDQREEDGIVVLLEDSPAESEREKVMKAAKLCPARVIILENA